MRYALNRYDNVFGDTTVTMVVNDVYFNRVDTHFYGENYASLNDLINDIKSFIGSDDFLNIRDLRYIPVGDAPYFNDAVEIANRLHISTPYNGIPYDDQSHDITGIIKIDDKTTIYVDTGMATITGYRILGSYAAGALSNVHQYSPWAWNTSVGGDTSDNKNAFVFLSFRAFPENIINEHGIIDATEGGAAADVAVWIYARHNILGDITQYVGTCDISYGAMSREIVGILNGDEPPEQDDPDNDPYSGDESDGGGESGEGGGPDASGAINWDIPAGDATPVPPLPSLSVADTGFITLYNPSATQLKNLASYMWGNLFDISTWKKVLADPMDAIIGLSLVPVNVPSSGSQTVTVGNISTGITLTKASTQFVEVDCGSVKIDEIWKAYLDYSPYTKISIYLPYIGSQELDIDLYQNTTIGVKYHIDILSGACVAYVTVNGNVVCQFSGQCAVSIPITSQDFTQTITTLATLVASGVGVVATGGMSAPVQGAAIAGLATAAANTAANVISSKPIYAKTGNMSGSNGLMGVQTPYLIIEHARQCAPASQNKYTGYPSYITKTLSTLSGFTQVQDIKLNNINCTNEERNEILELLRNGVIL